MMMITNLKEHYGRIRSILIWVLALNWLVAFAKIIFGFLSRCQSMTADGFHSLSDGASNIICLIGIHFASQPVDKDHPYGHKKYETVFSLGIAGLLSLLCFNLIKEGIKRLKEPAFPQIDPLSFIIMIATLAINFWVMKYEYNKGKHLKSDILVSDSLHTRADILTSISVIFGLIAMKFGGLFIIDPIVTLVIALFIAHAAFEIIKEASSILCDTAVIMEDKRIADIVLAVKGVKACHKIRTRGRIDDIHIDLHVQVNGDMHINEAHKISYNIEETLRKGIPGVTDVVVHMEPREKN
jgi:cation diffusion facilitator family transporter